MTTRPWTLAIDFGTSYTVAAAHAEAHAPEILEIDGNRRVPSVILAEGDTYVVGKLADELAATYPRRALRAPKRRLGDATPVVLDGRPHQVVTLVAALLRHVHEEAVRQFGSAPMEVRLTHPAVWQQSQLARLADAASAAGIEHPVLVPEPVAAALAYATEVGVAAGTHVAVYDLGGGTFDTAVVTPTDAGFRIVGRPGGDPDVGGELFDELLYEHIGANLDPATWDALQSAEDATWRRLHANLWSEVRRAKELLSGYPVAEIVVPLPGGPVPVSVQREDYEALIDEHVEATVSLLARCVRDAGTDPSRLGAIYLVGGASRTPLVSTLIERRFPGIPISRRGDPKTSTALGAVLAVRSGPVASRPAGSAPTPPPTPIGTEPVAKPPSVPPPSGPPTNPPPTRPATPSPASGPPRVAPAAASPTPQPAPTTAQAPRTLVQTRPTKQRRRRWPILLLIVALLAAGGAAAWLVLGGDDEPAAEDPQVSAGSELCVRADIESAALRESMERDAPLVTRIPSGTCGVAATGEPQLAAGSLWVPVDWEGTQGYSALANFEASPEEATDVAESVVRRYYDLVNAENTQAAWDLLTPNQQAAFGGFNPFVDVWARIDKVTIVDFTGCSADGPTTTCTFVADFANEKGGTSRNEITVSVVDDGGAQHIDATPKFELVECTRLNPGENDCAAN